MPIPWNGDPPAFRLLIEQNVAAVVRSIRDDAPRRDPPSVATARRWHREVYRGVPLPVPYYAGEVRDDDKRFPELIGYEVAVGRFPGVPSAEVPTALDRFERSMQHATAALDPAVPGGTRAQDAARLTAVVQLAGLAHGEWVRIHPFANGNGRTARLWVAWVAARYGLPLFLRLKPRPSSTRYALAFAASMLGNHNLTHLYLADLLAQALGRTRRSP
ncbi:MAG TPA: Fic family protein [Chloroflexota bacterium]